jgi:acetyl esterase/lipase
MIYVHGGGGRRGDKAWANDIAAKPAYFMTKEGAIFVSVNYRLGDAGQYPVAQQDVANAVAWVHDNIARYGGDPNRIFMSGHSSGAALVARVATIPTFLEKAGKSLGVVKGAITIDGGNFARGDNGQASPVQSVATLKSAPSLLMLHIGKGGGTEKDATAMAAAMRAAGHRAEAVALPGKDHFSASSDIGRHDDPSTIAVRRFLGAIAGSTN